MRGPSACELSSPRFARYLHPNAAARVYTFPLPASRLGDLELLRVGQVTVLSFRIVGHVSPRRNGEILLGRSAIRSSATGQARRRSDTQVLTGIRVASACRLMRALLGSHPRGGNVWRGVIGQSPVGGLCNRHRPGVMTEALPEQLRQDSEVSPRLVKCATGPLLDLGKGDPPPGFSAGQVHHGACRGVAQKEPKVPNRILGPNIARRLFAWRIG